MALRLISDDTHCHLVAKILDRRQSQGQSYLNKRRSLSWIRKYKWQNIIFAGGWGKKNSIRGLFRVLIRRRVFLETFGTKCPSSLEESSEKMSTAENSPTLLARRAA
jgi:hypothetical protein